MTGFSFFKFLIFHIFRILLVLELKFQQASKFRSQLARFQPSFMINMLVMAKYKQLSFFGDLLNLKKNYGTLEFLLTQDHVWLEISKGCSYSFHPISVKHYEDIGYHGGTQAVTSLRDWPIFKNVVVL